MPTVGIAQGDLGAGKVRVAELQRLGTEARVGASRGAVKTHDPKDGPIGKGEIGSNGTAIWPN